MRTERAKRELIAVAVVCLWLGVALGYWGIEWMLTDTP